MALKYIHTHKHQLLETCLWGWLLRTPQGQVAGFLPETKAGCCHICPSNGTQELQGWGTCKTTQKVAERWMVESVLLLTLLLYSMPCFMSLHIRYLKQISGTYPKDAHSFASFIELRVTLENIERDLQISTGLLHGSEPTHSLYCLFRCLLYSLLNNDYVSTSLVLFK